MREYTIVRRGTPFSWSQVPTLPIDTLLWSPQVPITAQAQLCYDDTALYVRLCAVEPEIRAEETDPLGAPCRDSCLEFFFCPISGDRRYFNIEFNPNGCLCLGLGGGAFGSLRLVPKAGTFDQQISRTQDGWELEYRIPYTFVRQVFPDFSPVPGSSIRANCYKCGDRTVQPHYLAWNPIDLPKPKFHCPEQFGTMYFE